MIAPLFVTLVPLLNRSDLLIEFFLSCFTCFDIFREKLLICSIVNSLIEKQHMPDAFWRKRRDLLREQFIQITIRAHHSYSHPRFKRRVLATYASKPQLILNFPPIPSHTPFDTPNF